MRYAPRSRYAPLVGMTRDVYDKKLKFKNEDIISLMTHDKKVENSKINLLLPIAPAEVALFDNIDLLSIEASLL